MGSFGNVLLTLRTQHAVGTAFPVPLLTTQWGIGDSALLANGAWTAYGNSTGPSPAAANSTYPTWLSVAPIGQNVCGIVIGQ